MSALIALEASVVIVVILVAIWLVLQIALTAEKYSFNKKYHRMRIRMLEEPIYERVDDEEKGA